MNATAKQLAPYVDAIDKTRDKFIEAAGDLLQYENESVFAMQALSKNDSSISVANSNPKSVQIAMRNVAATGLTLNPAHAYAYLVPRDGAIVLDISYKGLIKIATDCGAILWARADVVYSADTFTYNGPAEKPDHQSEPFKKERGEVIGAYCIAKTREGDILCEILPLEEIEKIRGKSDLFKKKGSGPWVEWFNQMAKKAVVKRASKTWPYTGHSGRLFEAIELASSSEGGYTFEQDDPGKNDIHKKGATEGMWEAMTDAQKEVLRKHVAIIREYFDAEDPRGAVAYLDRQTIDIEERAAMWTQLSSKIRTAINVTRSTMEQLEQQ
jgi:recombination protein RecT